MTSRRERPPSGRTNTARSGFTSSTWGESVVNTQRERPQTANRASSPRKDFLPPTIKALQQPYYAQSSSNNLSGNGARPSSGIASGQRNERPIERPKTASAVSQSSHQQFNSSSNNNNNNNNQNQQHAQPQSHRSQSSARSQETEISTNEVLRRMREKSDVKRHERESAEIDALGDYNAFSRPRVSAVAPLRSMLLDPEVNNFPKSRTRTELMKRIRYANMPHPSYDLDNDGYVSTEDYKLAKRFDFDGNGLLDPEERGIGKRVLADEFFKRHSGDLQDFGSGFEKRTHKENVEKLVNSYSFEHTYGKLLSVERTLKAESGKPLLDCIRNDNDPDFQRHKYYQNKMDSTAWTDFTRLPRSSWMTLTHSSNNNNDNSLHVRPLSPSAAAPFATSFNNNFGQNSNNYNGGTFGTMSQELGHCGSRKRLLFTRQQQLRTETDARMQTHIKVTAAPTRKVNLISDISRENS